MSERDLLLVLRVAKENLDRLEHRPHELSRSEMLARMSHDLHRKGKGKVGL